MSNFEKDMNKLRKLYAEHKQEEFMLLFQQMQEKYNSQEFKEKMLAFVKENQKRMHEELDEIEKNVELYSQIEPYKEIIPFKYIAEQYFGKSASWLSQRIKGTPVRGKVYTLKPTEIATFNQAIHDIGNKLGSFTIL